MAVCFAGLWSSLVLFFFVSLCYFLYQFVCVVDLAFLFGFYLAYVCADMREFVCVCVSRSSQHLRGFHFVSLLF